MQQRARGDRLGRIALYLATIGCVGCVLLCSGDLVNAIWPALFGNRTILCMFFLVLASSGAVVAAVNIGERNGWREIRASVAAVLVGTLLTWIGSFVAYFMLSDVIINSHGRRLRRFRKVRVPETRPGAWRAPRPTDAAPAALVLDAPSELRTQLGQAWRETACKEHAAIASFSQLSLDLLAVGAPPYLLEITQADAGDEIRHTSTCLAIAQAFDGQEHAPAAFPAARMLRPLATRSRPLALLQIALDSLADGVLNEGMSARVLAKLADRSADPRLGALLRGMAVDEARHAAHSWRIVEWCVAEGGSSVHRALLAGARQLPQRMEAELDDGAADGGWERWGLQGKALERAAFARTRDNAVRKLANLSLHATSLDPHRAVS